MPTNRGAFKKGEKRPRQGKRGPNKATKDVREAVALIARSNVSKVQGWLERVALLDPDKALDLYLKLIEYHIPKLARSEHTGADGGAIVVRAEAHDERL